ncbi:MAG: HTTM domain-containing protein [Planctomycetota bacterium]
MSSNAPLVTFRVLFGLLMLLESWGAIATGWVASAFVEPRLTFPVGDLVFLRALSGPGMYGYFVVMGFASLGVLLGWRYRWSSLALAVLWTGAYMAQKSHYNNHYYLAALFAWAMALLPAADRASFDVAAGRRARRVTTDPWVARAFRIQVLIVFTYAAVAKLYPGWLNGDYLRVNLGAKGDRWPLGSLVVQPWFQTFTIYAALIFDALVIPALWWRRTRVLAFVGLIGFNLFNSVVFRIGIFPYMVLGLTVFFFSEASVERAFRWLPGMAPGYDQVADDARRLTARPSGRRVRLGLLGVFLAVQTLLPLRHHLYESDVTWTEEGHRMSWRMMLRTKSAKLILVAEDPATGRNWTVDQSELLSPRQEARVAGHPDFLYRFVQDLKAQYRSEGIEAVRIFARYSACSLNGAEPSPLYNGEVDLAQVTWHRFSAEPWLVPQRRSE